MDSTEATGGEGSEPSYAPVAVTDEPTNTTDEVSTTDVVNETPTVEEPIVTSTESAEITETTEIDAGDNANPPLAATSSGFEAVPSTDTIAVDTTINVAKAVVQTTGSNSIAQITNDETLTTETSSSITKIEMTQPATPDAKFIVNSSSTSQSQGLSPPSGSGGGEMLDRIPSSSLPTGASVANLNKEEPIIELDPWTIFRNRIKVFLDSTEVSIIMSLVTVFALYGDDIRVRHAEMSADLGFTVILIIAMILFVIEFVLSCMASPEYANWTYECGKMPTLKNFNIGSFYFWLDIIATVSLAIEIDWDGQTDTAYDVANNDSAEASKSGDAFSKRFYTMARMVRIVRMVKFYKYYQLHKKKKEAEERALAKQKRTKSFNKQAEVEVEVEYTQESRVGQAMTDLTTQRVIWLVFVLLLVIPLLTPTDPTMGSVRYKTRFMRNMRDYHEVDGTFVGYDVSLTYLYGQKEVLAIMKDSSFLTNATESKSNLEDLRSMEVTYYEDSEVRIFEDNVNNVQTDALWSLLLSTFVVVLLMVGTYVFSNDVTILVITPIERMVALVQKISVNPLGVEYSMMGAEDGFMEGMETTLLLQTITKIGSLMRVGFGDAGASTIAKNLAESKGGRLNMMGAGTTIHAIFGFCDVRQFTDTTECLQEEVMLFVNRIAHILHSIVVQCSGSANKNIGDAFLLTWKIDEKLPEKKKSALADQALVAFLKGLVELNRHQDFICNFSVQATARLYKRFPGYNVRIGCGLHFGWAIEGAIGSYRKIDASYLSPSVNMSEYLESSTKAYGVPILLSEPFFRLLTPEAIKYCRQVDRIFGPLDDPFGIFTYDADLDYDFNAIVATTSALKAANVFKQKLAARKAARESSRNTRRSSMFSGLSRNDNDPQVLFQGAKRSTIIANAPVAARRSSAFNDIEMQKISDQQKKLKAEKKNKAPEIKIHPYDKGVWERDSDLIQLRHLVNESFRATWKGGIEAYIAGDWDKAIGIFKLTSSSIKGGDGPSKFLLDLMESMGGRAPADWKGYRLD